MTQTLPRNPFTREDTFFGVCQALGDDFRFNPIWLRLAFAGAFFWNPLAAAAAYAALGTIVLASRLIVRNPRQPKAPQPVMEVAAEAPAPQPLHADNETVAEVLAVAA